MYALPGVQIGWKRRTSERQKAHLHYARACRRIDRFKAAQAALDLDVAVAVDVAVPGLVPPPYNNRGTRNSSVTKPVFLGAVSGGAEGLVDEGQNP